MGSNENSINAIGLDFQKNNFAHASCFFVHFFAIIKWLQHKTSYFHTTFMEWVTTTEKFLFLFLNLDVQSVWIQPHKILLTFDIK